MRSSLERTLLWYYMRSSERVCKRNAFSQHLLSSTLLFSHKNKYVMEIEREPELQEHTLTAFEQETSESTNANSNINNVEKSFNNDACKCVKNESQRLISYDEQMRCREYMTELKVNNGIHCCEHARYLLSNKEAPIDSVKEMSNNGDKFVCETSNLCIRASNVYSLFCDNARNVLSREESLRPTYVDSTEEVAVRQIQNKHFSSQLFCQNSSLLPCLIREKKNKSSIVTMLEKSKSIDFNNETKVSNNNNSNTKEVEEEVEEEDGDDDIVVNIPLALTVTAQQCSVNKLYSSSQITDRNLIDDKGDNRKEFVHPSARGVPQNVCDLVTDAFEEQREEAIKERRRILYELTHPIPNQYTYKEKLVPPPPLNFGVITDIAKEIGNKLMLDQTYKLVNTAGVRVNGKQSARDCLNELEPQDLIEVGADNVSPKLTVKTQSLNSNNKRMKLKTRRNESRENNIFRDHNYFFEINELYQEIVLIGKANAGKSSLLNALLGQHVAKTSSTPNSTKGINFYQSVSAEQLRLFYEREHHNLVKLPGKGLQLTFVDVPGFGIHGMSDKWRDGIITLTDSYFGVRRSINTVLFCIDCERGLTKSDAKYFQWLENVHGMFFVVLTKCDSVPHSRVCSVMRQIYVMITEKRRKYRKVYPFIIPTSARDGTNIEMLRGLIAETSGFIPANHLRKTLEELQKANEYDALLIESKRLEEAQLHSREEARKYFIESGKSEQEGSFDPRTRERGHDLEETLSADMKGMSLAAKVAHAEVFFNNHTTYANDAEECEIEEHNLMQLPRSKNGNTLSDKYVPSMKEYKVNTGIDNRKSLENVLNSRYNDLDQVQRRSKEERITEHKYTFTEYPQNTQSKSSHSLHHKVNMELHAKSFNTHNKSKGNIDNNITSNEVINKKDNTLQPKKLMEGNCKECYHDFVINNYDEKDKLDSSTKTSLASSRIIGLANNCCEESACMSRSFSSRDVTSVGKVSNFLSTYNAFANQPYPHTNHKRRTETNAKNNKQPTSHLTLRARPNLTPQHHFFVQDHDGQLQASKAGRCVGPKVPSLHTPVDSRLAIRKSECLKELLCKENPEAPWNALSTLSRKAEHAKEKMSLNMKMGTKERAAYLRNAGRVIESFDKFEGEVTMKTYMNEKRMVKTLRKQQQLHLNATARINYTSMPAGLWRKYNQANQFHPTPRVLGREYDESHQR